MEVKENRIVVGAGELCIDSPVRNGGRESTHKGDVNTGLSDSSLKGGGVVRILDSQAVSKNKFLKACPLGF